MRFPFCRNRDFLKNGTLISIRRTGDGFHPGLFKMLYNEAVLVYEIMEKELHKVSSDTCYDGS